MERIIVQPSYYSGQLHLEKAVGTEWDYFEENDVKMGTGFQISSTAVEEISRAVMVTSGTIDAAKATDLCQEFTDPGTDLACWHYDLWMSLQCDLPGLNIFPFCSHQLPADADSRDFQFLPAIDQQCNIAKGVVSSRSQGQVIRVKAGEAEDTQPFVFGWILNNSSDAAITVEGVAQMNVYPNSKQLTISMPGI